MMSLAVLLLIHGTTGSYAVAGLAVGAYNVAGAAAAPVMGRLIDRCGARRTLAVGGVVQPLALAGVALLAHAAPTAFVLVLACGVAGAALPPPVTGAMRSLWPRVVPADRRSVAYSLEAVATEMVFIAGPLLVAVLVAIGSATGAVLAAAALSAAGSLGMAIAVPGRDRRPAADGRRARSPLARRGFQALLLITVADATALGCLELAVAGRATEAGQPALTGILLALMAGASVVGGLWFAGRTWGAPPAHQYGWLLGFMAIGLLPAVVAPGLGALGLALVLVGAMIAPVGAVQGELVATVAPADALGEAFTWIGAVSFAGYSLGTTWGGHLMQSGGSLAAVLAAAAASAVAATGAFVLRSALRPAPTTAA
jgi:MFS family permease